ncbi:4-(cytidine 5'-diphospho)-2-C-methyl-D-erythritol kinase [Allosphingosinicella sp.]|jgi:4-diphosphocytidyl-2-C-methyl-D-erythritol kinase|uniref:4-(cytidine 5'-diphospho)-2-C-methyl-D-erythritol kinase n=1 Tax=Allosphingosinicella sp. TaxID=2823234 RepID=UPI002EE78E0C
MEEIAYAKINLALHVRGREPDGYHRIETIFAFCEDGDRLRISDGEELALDLCGPFAGALDGGRDNLAMRAAQALAARYGVRRGAKLALDKRLPVAAGLGGGSADAAAALRLLPRWWGIEARENELLEIAAELGADVPACLLSRTVRGEGKGDWLGPFEADGLSGMPVLLVNPGVPLSTASVFRAWGGIDQGPLEGLEAGRNDLEPAAIGMVPEIAELLRLLSGARLARMSGSGASCFGLFDSEVDRDSASGRIGEVHPGWWQLSTRLR